MLSSITEYNKNVHEEELQQVRESEEHNKVVCDCYPKIKETVNNETQIVEKSSKGHKKRNSSMFTFVTTKYHENVDNERWNEKTLEHNMSRISKLRNLKIRNSLLPNIKAKLEAGSHHYQY